MIGITATQFSTEHRRSEVPSSSHAGGFGTDTRAAPDASRAP